MPAAGRLGAAPEWPLAVLEPTSDELVKWREMWTLPQALIWEADKAHDLVAFYVRTYLEAMMPRAGAQSRIFVRQLSNDLFLAPAALASGRYVIEGTAEASALDAAMATGTEAAGAGGRAPRKRSARSRLTVVQPDPIEDDEPDEDTTTGGKPETDQTDPGEVPPF